MIDPTQLPILLKAIDFVFEEGRKILEERRERRKSRIHPQKARERNQPRKCTPVEVQEKNEIKQDLLTSKVDDILWHNHEQELQHLVRLLDTYSSNYYLSREQYAKWGCARVHRSLSTI